MSLCVHGECAKRIYAPKKNVPTNLCAYGDYTKFGHSCRQNLSVSGEYAKRISANIDNANRESKRTQRTSKIIHVLLEY
jgi:hypothetical protein